ncbi:MAG: ABC transporter permease [Anaerolineae bacterium]|nr:ABC transporter permease [Anaerolineae bacterium]
MSLRRIAILLGKELIWGPRNFLFIFAIIIPLVLTLLINLLVGTYFSGKPRLGVTDAGTSAFVAQARSLDGIVLREYGDAAALQDAVTRGAVDLGVVLPAGFDEQLKGDAAATLTVYVYGESLLKNRAILATAITNLIRDLSGQPSPVTIVSETLGDSVTMPWEQRLLPLVVLMTVILGGSMVPATSLVEEKQKRTITAITTTSTSLGELFLAKGILGVLISLTMGIVILVLNGAFGSQPLLLIGLLFLGATLAASFGVLLGALVKDINTLFATIKGIGILLYAPAIIYLFPSIPAWIGRIFPTYYIITPIVEVTQNGATWSAIRLDVGILILLILALMGIVAFITRQARSRPTMLPGIVS